MRRGNLQSNNYYDQSDGQSREQESQPERYNDNRNADERGERRDDSDYPRRDKRRTSHTHYYERSDGQSRERERQQERYNDNRRDSNGRGEYERRRDLESHTHDRSPPYHGRYDPSPRHTNGQHRTNGGHRAPSHPSSPSPSRHHPKQSREVRSKDYPTPGPKDLRHRLDFSSDPVRNDRHEFNNNGNDDNEDDVDNVEEQSHSYSYDDHNGNDDNEEAQFSFDGSDHRNSIVHRSDEEDARDGIEVQHVYHPDDPHRPDDHVVESPDRRMSLTSAEANSLLLASTPQPSASQSQEEYTLPPANDTQDPPEQPPETMEVDEVAPVAMRPTSTLLPLGCGFVNSHSYCYFNSVAQVLFRSPLFVIQLTLLRDLLLVKSLFIKTLIDKCASFQRSSGRSMELAALRRQVFSLDNFKKFQTVDQNDPHEFLMLLFDALAQEVAPALNSAGPFVDSSFLNNFAYLIRDTRCCQSCGHLSHMDEIQYSLALRCANPGNQSLEELLKEYFADELVVRRCDECQEGQFAMKSKVLLRPPAQLVCYVATHYTDDGSKLLSRVRPQMSLDLSAIGVCETPQALHFALMLKNNLGLTEAIPATPMRSDVRERYQLSAVICHKGEKNTSGHYIAVALDHSSQRWFSYNDAEVTQVDETELFSAEWTPVLYFYHLASEVPCVEINPIQKPARLVANTPKESDAYEFQDFFAKLQREEVKRQEETSFLKNLIHQELRQQKNNLNIFIEKFQTHSNISQSTTSNAEKETKRKLSDSTNNSNEDNVPGKKVKL